MQGDKKDKKDLQIIIISHINAELQNDASNKGVPIASFFLSDDGKVRVVSHIKETPYIVIEAKKEGIYSPFVKKKLTIRDGKHFISALLWRLHDVSYIKIHAFKNNKPVSISFDRRGNLIIRQKNDTQAG